MPDTEIAKPTQTEIIAFRLDPELMKKVERIAHNEGLTLSAVARRALLRDLKANSNPQVAQ